MSNTFLEPGAHSGRRTLLVALVALVAVLLVGAGAVLAVLAGRSSAVAAVRASPPAVQPSGTAASVSASESSPVVTSLRLVRGRAQIAGVAVGYPHSTVGAVSAASEFAGAVATLDPDRDAAVGRLVVDDTWALAPQEFAAAALTTRRSMGLSSTGDVPAGASVEITPMDYQVRRESADTVMVLLLSYYVTTSPQGGTLSRTILVPMPMHWSGLDWKVLKPTDADDTRYADLMASPATAAAARLGWRGLVR